jgi:RHS repeat-associated protein
VGNTLLDPGFENGLNGWGESWGSSLTVTAESAHSGSWGVEGGGTIYQDLPSSPGDVWTASAWAMENDWQDNGDGSMGIQVVFLDGNGSVIANYPPTYFDVEDWQHFSYTSQAAPAGTAKARIYFSQDQNGYLDDCAGTGPAPVARGVAWSQWYAYDGFGNMTEKESTTGTVMTVAVNPATNQIVGQPYDANGNMLGQTVTYMLNGQQITGPSNTWDAENRLSFQVLDGTPYQYTYDPSGRRVVTQNMAPSGGVVKTTFYGAAGERVTWGATSESYVRFAGRTISFGTREVKDRLGSVRATEAGQNFQYMPYGEAEGGVVADGRVRFGTYVRDSTPSAQDYAGARYYSNVYGRFFGADPGGIATANPKNPSSWNRYAYVNGDPVNFHDPSGRLSDIVSCGAGDSSYGDPTCIVFQDDSDWGFGPGDTDPCAQQVVAYWLLKAYACVDSGGGQAAPPPSALQSCEQAEAAYLAAYLSKRNSPLAAIALTIVEDSDAAGLDDRFIVALAGAETTYGRIKHASTWGVDNVFDNTYHCYSLKNPLCVAANPYTSYQAAVAGVTSQLDGTLYAGLETANGIFKEYSGGGGPATLDKIDKQLGVDPSDVRAPRCQ